MALRLKPVKEQVIVITGATSGIGLATARAAAKEGARLVLDARNDEALQEVERQLEASPGQVTRVAADVSDRQQVERIAQAAIERFGRIDTWINNAGLSIFGRLEEVSEADSRRLFDVNFWGVVHGSLVALPHLKRQGGALINLGSVASDIALPMQGMYCASKHAIKGFTDALRQELIQERAPVAVTLIKPTSIDTPFPQHAKNYMEHEPRLPDPVYTPEEVARAILFAASHPRREIYVGGGGKALVALQRRFPHTMDRWNASFMPNQQQRSESPRDPQGALYRPGQDGRVRGDHPAYVLKTSAYTRASLHPALTGALVAVAGIAAAAWLTSSRWDSD